jgi:excisionase family DNA binding protein
VRLEITLTDGQVAEIARQVASLLAANGSTDEPAPCWFSPSEAADYLRVSGRTIEREIKRGRLRSTTIGRRRLIHRDDLDALARGGDGGGIAPTTPPRRREGVEYVVPTTPQGGTHE